MEVFAYFPGDIFPDLAVKIFAANAGEAAQIAEALRNRPSGGVIDKSLSQVRYLDQDDNVEIVVGDYAPDFADTYSTENGLDSFDCD